MDKTKGRKERKKLMEQSQVGVCVKLIALLIKVTSVPSISVQNFRLCNYNPYKIIANKNQGGVGSPFVFYW